MNRAPAAEEVSSANSVGGKKRELEAERGSEEEENGGVNTRKKLRLSKEQSAFLEESFKEHNTLNPVSSKFKFPKRFVCF